MESDIVSDRTNFNAVDITSLTSPVANDTKFKGVDILITSQWPKGVEKYGSALVRKWAAKGFLFLPFSLQCNHSIALYLVSI